MIYLRAYQTWQPIIAETDWCYLAKDVDGVMTYVIKDGMEMVK